MIIIDDKLVSEDLLEKQFVCNLSACKGECCVQGESGAPLEFGETEQIASNYDKIKKYMRPEGIAAVKEQGFSVIDADKDEVTPLVNNEECAYVFFDYDNIAKCAIEKAYREGEIDYYKPASCHLYPIRVSKLTSYTALNYHHWPICEAACDLGEQLKVPVFKFLKDPLIRMYGAEWYEQLEIVYQQWTQENGVN